MTTTMTTKPALPTNDAAIRAALDAAKRARRAPLRAALRAAKRDLTLAARDLAAATRAHLRALRAETRARPVWISPDSDAAVDLLARARDRYDSAASRVEYLGAEYRQTL